MTSMEKVAYLKGLIEGLDLDENPKERKLFSAIIDVLESLAGEVSEIQDTVADMSEELDDISEELEDVEDDLDCLGDYVFGDDEDEDDDDDDYWFDDDEEPVFYQVTCPACENTITIDEDVLMTGAISCPNCGETLEFDFSSIEDIEDEDESEEE